MNDEEYFFYTDCREKKNIANSAFKRRTHRGKGGRAILPSDHLSKKELEKMNGETKSYRLNEPVSWNEFREWPDDIKVMYIKLLREKFDVPGRRISDMMGVDAGQLARVIRTLGLAEKRAPKKPWDEEGWYAWCGLAPKPKKEVTEEETVVPEEVAEVQEAPEEIPAMENRFMKVVEEELAKHRIQMQEAEIPKVEVPKKVVPTTGNMVFEGLAEDVLETVRVLLGGGKCAYQYHLGCT